MAAKTTRGGEKKAGGRSKSVAKRPAAEGPNTLCVDVGGTGLKAIVLDAKGKEQCERRRIPTPRPATPAAVLAGIRSLVDGMPPFDRVSVGFPGVVKANVIMTAPNLDRGWAGFHLGAELEKMTHKPVRVLNDAGVQGYGVVKGKGVEMMLTLGTGMGHALFVNGTYVPNIELAHHPLKGKKTYEELVCDAQRKKLGRKRWTKRVHVVLETVQPIFNPDVIYLGGGNSRLVKGSLPANVKVTENIAGLLGGIALWGHEGRLGTGDGFRSSLGAARRTWHAVGVTEGLSEEERAWLARDELIWRRARELATANPAIDVSDLYHTLKNLERSPEERLARGLRHGRLGPR